MILRVWKGDKKFRTLAWCALYADGSFVLFDNIVCDGEPQALAFTDSFCRKKRIPDLIEQIGGHTATIVADNSLHLVIGAAGLNLNMVLLLVANFFNRLQGVHNQIQKDLAQRTGITLNGRQGYLQVGV